MRPGDGCWYQPLAVLLGGLVVVAALLKGIDGATTPGAVPPLLQLALAGCELFLGLWLLSGLHAHAARLAALAAFCCFCFANLVSLAAGASSCGCFGPIRVHPWYVLGLDVAAVVGLWVWKPSAHHDATIRSHPLRFAAVCGLALTLAGAGAAARLSAGPAEEHVVIDPAAWAGNRLPLLPDIDIGDRLAEGSWLLVFYREGCEDCHRQLPRLEEAACREHRRLALVAVPPHPPGSTGLTSAAAHGAEYRGTRVRLPLGRAHRTAPEQPRPPHRPHQLRRRPGD